MESWSANAWSGKEVFQSLAREALFRETIYKGLRYVWEIVDFMTLMA